MVLYPNKLPESERVCSGICNRRFTFRLFHLQLYGWTVARLAGYPDFGNLGLLNLDCLA